MVPQNKKIKLITCRALADILAPMLDARVERRVLPISLHLSRDNLREALLAEIQKIEEDGCDILLGYGLCGRGVEGVYSEKSRLILPKVDDCVGALLGSRQRHRAVISEHSGCFFLEPSWIGSEVDVFTQCMKGLDRIPEEYREQIMHMAIRHYKKLALIDHEFNTSLAAKETCRNLAQEHKLEFMQLEADLQILEDLVTGNWSSERFVIIDPGEKIPLF